MGIFDYNGKLMDALRRFSDVVVYNIIFCAFSLPIITAGASMCALCEGMRMIAADEEFEDGCFRTFLSCFKRNFKRGTALWLLVLLGVLVLAAILFGARLMPVGVRSMYVITFYVLSFLFVFGYQYLFPLAAAYEDLGVGQIIKNSCLCAVAALPQTLLCILVTGAFVYVTLVLNLNVFRFGIFLWCSCGFGIMTYLNAFFFLRVQRKIEKKE